MDRGWLDAGPRQDHRGDNRRRLGNLPELQECVLCCDNALPAKDVRCTGNDLAALVASQGGTQ
jgi:hypothetical protein